MPLRETLAMAATSTAFLFWTAQSRIDAAPSVAVFTSDCMAGARASPMARARDFVVSHRSVKLSPSSSARAADSGERTNPSRRASLAKPASPAWPALKRGSISAPLRPKIAMAAAVFCSSSRTREKASASLPSCSTVERRSSS